MVAELKIPLPMEVFAVLNIAGLAVCLFVSARKDENEEHGKENSSKKSQQSSTHENEMLLDEQ